MGWGGEEKEVGELALYTYNNSVCVCVPTQKKEVYYDTVSFTHDTMHGNHEKK